MNVLPSRSIDILKNGDDGHEIRGYRQDKPGAVDRLPYVIEKMDVVRASPPGDAWTKTLTRLHT